MQKAGDGELPGLLVLHRGFELARALTDAQVEIAMSALQRFGRLLLCREIARDFRETESAAAEAPRDAAAEEAGAALADVIPFVRRAADTARLDEFLGRNVRGAVFRREQHVEVPADHFIRRVSEHPFGSRVPRIDR